MLDEVFFLSYQQLSLHFEQNFFPISVGLFNQLDALYEEVSKEVLRMRLL